MARKTAYTKKDFYIALALTGAFVALYLASFYGIAISSDEELREVVRLHEFVNGISAYGFFVLLF